MARKFNGTTDRIDYGSPFNTTGHALTISAWVWFDVLSPAANSYIFNSATAGGAAGTIFFQGATNPGQLDFVRIGSINMEHLTTSNTVPAANVWTHVYASSDGDMASAAATNIFVNGGGIPGYDTTTNGSTESVANSGFQIGGRSSDDLRNFAGRIAELAVWPFEFAGTAGGGTGGSVRRMLATGYSPEFFPGYSLYVPLKDNVRDSNGVPALADGTLPVIHPLKIIYPQNRRRYFFGSAAAPSFNAAWASQRSRILGAGVY